MSFKITTKLVVVFITGLASPSFAVEAMNPSNTIRALLVPKVETVLSSQIDARIEAIHVQNGDRFKKGQILVQFACGKQKALLSIAQAEQAQAKVTFETNQKLRERKAISHLNFALSKVEFMRAQAQVSLRQVPVDDCDITAPFSGRIVKRLAQPFQTVSSADPILEILDDSQLKIEIYVPSTWLQWLSKKTTLKVRIDESGKTYPAKISTIGARVDAVSQTIALTAIIKGKHRELLAGMSGVAHFKTNQ